MLREGRHRSVLFVDISVISHLFILVFVRPLYLFPLSLLSHLYKVPFIFSLSFPYQSSCTILVLSLYFAKKRFRFCSSIGVFRLIVDVFCHQVVKKLKPEFLALHCQEVGGKNYEESMQHVNKFVK